MSKFYKGKTVKLLQVIFISLLIIKLISSSSIRFTNVRCEMLDKSFAMIKRCDLKVIKRGQIGLNIHAQVYAIPITNATVNLALFKKVNGYLPFLYNYTTDICEFLKRPKERTVLKLALNAVLKYSNINTSCPWNKDLIVKDFVLDSGMFALIPLPTGEYMYKIKIATYNIWRAEAKFYVATEGL